jgi:hypothetical protein
MTAPVLDKAKEKERMGLKSAGAGLRSSRTVEVDSLRNEMERAIRANGVDLGKAEGENGEVVRNDSEFSTPNQEAVSIAEDRE